MFSELDNEIKNMFQKKEEEVTPEQNNSAEPTEQDRAVNKKSFFATIGEINVASFFTERKAM